MEVATLEEVGIIELKKRYDKPPKNRLFLFGLLFPGLIIFILSILFPIVIGIFISFTDSSGATGYFGQRVTIVNYYELLTFGNFNTRDFWQYTYQTLFFSVVSLIIEFFLGLMFALILNKEFKGRGIARATLLIPWAIPTVASGTIFRFEIFNTADEYGLMNSLISLLGARPISFFGPDAPILFNLPVLVPYSPYLTEVPITMTMFTAIFIDVWKTTPFIALLILAALQIVPDDLYKAGDVAGATGWQKFRYITLPLIKSGLGVALIFRMMQALRVYDAIVVFNDSTVRSMTSHSVLLWLNGDYGMASAVTVMLLLFIVLFAIIIVIFTRTEKTKIKKPKLRAKGIFSRIKLPKKAKIETSINNPGNNKANPLEETTDDKIILNSNFLEETLSEIRLEPISESKVRGYIRKRQLRKITFALLTVFMCLFCAAPFLWIVLKSFRDPYIIQTEFELFPKYFSFRAYEVIFESSDVYGITFERALLNGLLLSGATVLVVLIVGSLIAYAIAKFDFRFKKPLNGFIFSMNSLPPLIIIIPFYIQIIAIGSLIPALDIRDNLAGLILPYSAFNLPLAVFILVAFFKEIPEDLWSAAKVDGATNFQIFRKVILPLTIPGIFTCAILVFIASWNELLFAQIFLTSPVKQTVPRTILRYIRNPQSLTAPWDTDIALMAATSLATIPLIIVVLIFQKKIISGLTRGAVKG